MKKIKLMVLKALFIILSLFVVSQQAFALKCINSNITNISNIDTIDPSIVTNLGTLKIINSPIEGTIVWQASYSLNFTCYDDKQRNSSEKIYIYLDDANHAVGKYFKNKNLKLGVNYDGQDYIVSNTSREVKVEVKGTKALKEEQYDSQIAKDNCKAMGKKWSESNPCASPTQHSINYTLFLQMKSSGGRADGNLTLQAFQVDGSGGRNSSGNYSHELNFGDIVYISCLPQPTSQEVYLGSYYVNDTPSRKVPFDINIKAEGGDCADNIFYLKMNASTMGGNNTAIQTTNNNVGIQIFEKDSVDPLDFSTSSGSTIESDILTGNNITKSLDAKVVFNGKPSVGEFTGALSYEIWIK